MGRDLTSSQVEGIEGIYIRVWNSLIDFFPGLSLFRWSWFCMWTFRKESKSVPTKCLLLIRSLLLFLLILSLKKPTGIVPIWRCESKGEFWARSPMDRWGSVSGELLGVRADRKDSPILELKCKKRVLPAPESQWSEKGVGISLGRSYCGDGLRRNLKVKINSVTWREQE